MIESSGSSSSSSFDFSNISLPTVFHETGERLHYSNFLITMNTNQTPSNEEEARHNAEVLENLGKDLFSSPNQIEKMVKFKVPTGRWDPSVIRRIRLVRRVEMGEKFRRIHLHVSLKLVHTSMLQLDIDFIQNAANELLSGTGLKIAYTHVSIHKTSPEDYINKF